MAAYAIQNTLSDEIFDAPVHFQVEDATRIRRAMKDLIAGKVVKTNAKLDKLSDEAVVHIWNRFEKDHDVVDMIDLVDCFTLMNKE